MMKFKLFALLICAIVAEVSGANIKAKFKVTVKNSDSTVYVTNQSSKDAVSYTINFGDGTISSYSQFSDYQHKYTVNGTYDVCLIVSDGVNSDTACEQVVLETAKDCSASFDYSVSGTDLTLINRSIGQFKKVTWTLADVKKVVNVDSFTYKFRNPGIYSISLNISDNKTKCNSTISKTVQVQGDTNTCLALFSYNYISDRKLQFVNTSLGDYNKLLWKFGNGDVSEDSCPEYEFANPGIYDVTLVVKSKNNKAKTSYTERIVIDEEKIELLPDFEATAYPDSLGVSFTDKSLGADIKQYTWAFGDGSVASGNSTYHTYNKPGDYNVCLTITPNAGSSASSCQLITVGTEYSLTPEFTYLFDKAMEASFLPYLSIEPDSLIWDFGDRSFSKDLQPVHVFKAKDVYLVGLKVYYKGKNAEKLQIINLTDDPSKLICMFKIDEEANMYKADSKKRRNKGSLSGDVSRIKYEWDFGDGTTDSLNLEPEHTYSTNGTYTVCFNVYNELTSDSNQYCQETVIGETTKIISQDLSDIDFYVNNSEGYIKININVPANKALLSNLDLYDIAGRVTNKVFSGTMNAGMNEFKTKTPKEKGIYIVRYQSANGYRAKKLVVY